MLLVDGVETIDDEGAVTIAKVRESWPDLSETGFASPFALIELCAQSIGVFVGYRDRNVKKMAGAGLLVGIRKAAFSETMPRIGETLAVHVRQQLERGDYGVFDVEVKWKSQSVLTAEIQVFRPPQEALQEIFGLDGLKKE